MRIVSLVDESLFTENMNLSDYRIFGIVQSIFVRTSVFSEFCQFKVSTMLSPPLSLVHHHVCHFLLFSFFTLQFFSFLRLFFLLLLIFSVSHYLVLFISPFLSLFACFLHIYYIAVTKYIFQYLFHPMRSSRCYSYFLAP